MKTAGIVYNPLKPTAGELVKKIQAWLEKREHRVLVSTAEQVDQVFEEAEIIICLGGDGTMLHVAGKMTNHSTPILGVNLGSLGFLTEVKEEEVFEELSAFFLDQSVIEERLMLSCSVKSEKAGKERRFAALNDIVISREGLSRIINIEIKIGGELFTQFSGDGVIVATPTGSTAYSLSAGGAVIHPKLEAVIINPICPHALALRSMVAPGNEKISVKVSSRSDEGRAVLSADGQENIEIDDSYSIEITQLSSPLRLVKSSKRSYLATLREKFKFPE